MNTFRTCLGLLCLSIALRADVLVMKNGDRVTGDIVKKDGNNLTVKTALFGTITLPWDQVDSVKTSTPLNVVLADGKTAQSNLETSNGKVDVGGQAVAPADVKVLRNAAEEKAYERLLHPGFLQLWSGAGTLGLAGTAGNSKTSTFAIGMNAARVTNTDKMTAYFNTVKGSSSVNGVSSDTAQAVRGGLTYSRNITKKIFFNGFNDWEYDRFQNLDLRFVLGGGAGYHVFKHDRAFLDVLAGMAFEHDKFDQCDTATTQNPCNLTAFNSTNLQQYTKNSANFYYGDDYSLKFGPRTSFTQSFRMFNNLSDTHAYRVNFDIGANTQFTKWMTWNLSVSDRFLNEPSPGRKRNDLLYTTGIGITFAH